MGIYENGTRHIELTGLTIATCDICGTMKQNEELVFTVKQVPVERGFNLFEIENAQGLSNSIRIAMNREGWTQEVFHGKSMVLCPKCSAL
jgi:hypothetical protein